MGQPDEIAQGGTTSLATSRKRNWSE
jgi:hypothetical protein